MGNSEQFLKFKRHKSHLFLPASRSVYTVVISKEDLTVTEQEVFLVFKRKTIKVIYKISDIEKITIKRTIDRLDLIGCFMCFVLGFLHPIGFLLFLLCIRMAFGAVAEIQKGNEELLIIQSESKRKLIELVRILQATNPKINSNLINNALIKWGIIILLVMVFLYAMISLT